MREETCVNCEEEISLREIIEIILKAKFFIIGFSILGLVLAFSYSMYMKEKSSYTQIPVSFTFEGIDEGKNPDGSAFKIDKLIEPDSLENVIAKLSLEKMNITVDDLRSAIEIQPIVPKNVLERVKKANEKGEDYSFFPTRYNIKISNKISGKGKTPNPKKILDSVFDEYINTFKLKYAYAGNLPNVVSIAKEENYDFEDRVRVYKKQILLFDNFLKEFDRKSSGYRSKNGLSFFDLSEKLRLIGQIELTKLESLISAFNISKDKTRLVQNLEHEIKLLELEKTKLRSEQAVSGQFIDKYKREDKVLLQGVQEKDTSITIGEKQEYYDELMKRATDSGVDASKLEAQISYIKSKIEKIMNDDVSKIDKTHAEKNFAEISKLVDQRLESLIKDANELSEDYFSIKYSTKIKKLAPSEFVSGTKTTLNLAIGFVLFMLLAVFISFFKNYWRESKVEIAKK